MSLLYYHHVVVVFAGAAAVMGVSGHGAKTDNSGVLAVAVVTILGTVFYINKLH